MSINLTGGSETETPVVFDEEEEETADEIYGFLEEEGPATPSEIASELSEGPSLVETYLTEMQQIDEYDGLRTDGFEEIDDGSYEFTFVVD